MKRCTRHTDIPKHPHFAIITSGSVHVPGDERSRTNPGHGYPEYTEYFIQYEAYDDREDWEDAIARRERSAHTRDKEYVAFPVAPAVIKTTTTIEIVG